MPVGQVI